MPRAAGPADEGSEHHPLEAATPVGHSLVPRESTHRHKHTHIQKTTGFHYSWDKKYHVKVTDV